MEESNMRLPKQLRGREAEIIEINGLGSYTEVVFVDGKKELIGRPHKVIMPFLSGFFNYRRASFCRIENLSKYKISIKKMKNLLLLTLMLFVFSSSKPAQPLTVLPVTTVSASTTLTSSNHVVINTGGAITLTLPAASTNVGLVLIVANHGTGAVTFSPSLKVGNTETLTSITYQLGGNLVTVISDGTNWRLIGQ